MTPRFKRSIVPSVIGGLLDCGSKFRVADLAAEDGGAQGKAGGGEGDEQDKNGAAADPVGPQAEENQSGQAAKAGDVKERSGLFGHLLVHLHGDIAPIVERGLDVAGIEAVVGPFAGLHDKGGDGTGEKSQGQSDGEDCMATGDEAGNEDGADDDGEGDGEVVEHDVEMLGLPEGGNHGPRLGRKGGLFQRKTNG